MNFDGKVYYRFRNEKFSIIIFHLVNGESYTRDIIVCGSNKEVYFDDEIEKHEINFAIVSSEDKIRSFSSDDADNLQLRGIIDALFAGVRRM